MNLDSISTNIIRLALYLNKKIPGTVSELWIEDNILKKLNNTLPEEKEIESLKELVQQQITSLTDTRRKQYLTEILHSIVYQLSAESRTDPYRTFSLHTFGREIPRISDGELISLETSIQQLEKSLHKTRYDILEQHAVKKDEFLQTFIQQIEKVKSVLPAFLIDFPGSEFLLETVIDKPWSAFNTHYAPYKSKLTLNTDIPFTTFDLYRLASHEAFGGHHAELSLKDNLLMNQGRGEHGLVLVFSPQVFISEAIAESMYVILKIRDDSNQEMVLNWHYDRLILGLQNLATHWFFDDKMNKEQIQKLIKPYGITEKAKEAVINFSTDPVYGRYAPIYYSAYNFLTELYEQANNPEEFIREVFTLPCTPKILIHKYALSF